MCRRWLLVGMGVLIVLTLFAAVWLSRLEPGGRLEPDVSLNRFLQIKLGMSVEDVDSIFGFRGQRGMGGEGEVSWSWTYNGNYVGISFGQEDGKARVGYFLSVDGKQQWLERKER